MTMMIFMFFVLLRAWGKKKIISPHEVLNLDLGIRAAMLYH